MFTAFASYNADINCPVNLEQAVNSNQTFNNSDGFYEESIDFSQDTLFSFLRIFTEGCSGIPAWIWLVIYLPTILMIIVYVTPFLGNG
jgi:hypothetical protein